MGGWIDMKEVRYTWPVLVSVRWYPPSETKERATLQYPLPFPLPSKKAGVGDGKDWEPTSGTISLNSCFQVTCENTIIKPVTLCADF